MAEFSARTRPNTAGHDSLYTDPVGKADLRPAALLSGPGGLTGQSDSAVWTSVVTLPAR